MLICHGLKALAEQYVLGMAGPPGFTAWTSGHESPQLGGELNRKPECTIRLDPRPA